MRKHWWTGGVSAGDETGREYVQRRVLVLEDLHWVDEPLLEFLEYLVDWAGEVPLFLLCIARPELYERRPGLASSHIDSDPN